ncbi:MAG: 7-carboxy-7-deazaguanine synthase [Rhodospirillaceae bacterium]|nr:MAG: 7-carboxy-7-deazaguanine synthase [Rhodospirillaceae bacterium]
MTYAVKEIYATLQGEGAQIGRAAVFLRFTGCNLWSGLEADRATAICRFCDTDFVGMDGVGGGRFSDAGSLARAVRAKWDKACDGRSEPLVVCTGGEPLLQLDAALVAALHGEAFRIAVETNGTQTPPDGIDWLCVSPKAGASLKVTRGDELKLVYPQAGIAPEAFEPLDFKHFFLQPLDAPGKDRHTAAARDYCLAHPKWRLSLQAHKLLGLP